MSEKTKPQLVGIVAMTPNRVIGKGNDLPWHLPEDLKFFKKTTLNYPILMGRKTFESIGRPLPKRHNIVLTRDENWSFPGVTTIQTLDQISTLGESIVYVIGGAQIYKLLLSDLDSLIISHVEQEYDGDTYFPSYEGLFKPKEKLLETDLFKVVRYDKK